MQNSSKLKWYVFYVKSRFEKRALKELAEKDFPCYLPMRKVARIYSGQRRWIMQPVFPSYIFVKAKHHQLTDIVGVIGILWWLKHAGEPATIREDHLQFIEKLLSSKTEFDVIKTELKEGDEITFKSGLFLGQKGVIKEIRGKRKFVVQIDGSGFTVTVDIENTDKI